MDEVTMRALGKVLGEVYRLQRRIAPTMVGVGDDTIYGLLHGFEDVLLEELNIQSEDGTDRGVSSAEVEAVRDILAPFWNGTKPKLTGFYDIEHDLQNAGIGRMKAKRILTYLKSCGDFTAEIKAMDSTNSPTECRTFEMDTWDK